MPETDRSPSSKGLSPALIQLIQSKLAQRHVSQDIWSTLNESAPRSALLQKCFNQSPSKRRKPTRTEDRAAAYQRLIAGEPGTPSVTSSGSPRSPMSPISPMSSTSPRTKRPPGKYRLSGGPRRSGSFRREATNLTRRRQPIQPIKPIVKRKLVASTRNGRFPKHNPAFFRPSAPRISHRRSTSEPLATRAGRNKGRVMKTTQSYPSLQLPEVHTAEAVQAGTAVDLRDPGISGIAVTPRKKLQKRRRPIKNYSEQKVESSHAALEDEAPVQAQSHEPSPELIGLAISRFSIPADNEYADSNTYVADASITDASKDPNPEELAPVSSTLSAQNKLRNSSPPPKPTSEPTKRTQTLSLSIDISPPITLAIASARTLRFSRPSDRVKSVIYSGRRASYQPQPQSIIVQVRPQSDKLSAKRSGARLPPRSQRSPSPHEVTELPLSPPQSLNSSKSWSTISSLSLKQADRSPSPEPSPPIPHGSKQTQHRQRCPPSPDISPCTSPVWSAFPPSPPLSNTSDHRPRSYSHLPLRNRLLPESLSRSEPWNELRTKSQGDRPRTHRPRPPPLVFTKPNYSTNTSTTILSGGTLPSFRPYSSCPYSYHQQQQQIPRTTHLSTEVLQTLHRQSSLERELEVARSVQRWSSISPRTVLPNAMELEPRTHSHSHPPEYVGRARDTGIGMRTSTSS